jgi:hypothetical protein
MLLQKNCERGPENVNYSIKSAVSFLNTGERHDRCLICRPSTAECTDWGNNKIKFSARDGLPDCPVYV